MGRDLLWSWPETPTTQQATASRWSSGSTPCSPVNHSTTSTATTAKQHDRAAQERGGLDEIPTNQAADGGCSAAVMACARQPRPLHRATGWSLVVVGNDHTVGQMDRCRSGRVGRRLGRRSVASFGACRDEWHQVSGVGQHDDASSSPRRLYVLFSAAVWDVHALRKYPVRSNPGTSRASTLCRSLGVRNV